MAAARTIGVPREVKEGEHRVAITPDGVSELRAPDHPGRGVRGARADAANTDDGDRRAGAAVVDGTPEGWARADHGMKV
jgi:alanine dehydrogenase